MSSQGATHGISRGNHAGNAGVRLRKNLNTDAYGQEKLL
jgi:hypothetical protein